MKRRLRFLSALTVLLALSIMFGGCKGGGINVSERLSEQKLQTNDRLLYFYIEDAESELSQFARVADYNLDIERLRRDFLTDSDSLNEYLELLDQLSIILEGVLFGDVSYGEPSKEGLRMFKKHFWKLRPESGPGSV